MQEHRRHKRFQVTFFMKIRQDDDDKAFGHIVDISASGFRALTDMPLSVDEFYVLEIDLPGEMNLCAQLIVNARCVWTRDVEETGAFCTGWQMIDVSEDDQDVITQLLEKLDEQ